MPAPAALANAVAAPLSKVPKYPDAAPATTDAAFLFADNFYLSKDELLHDSPSWRAGVDAETETSLRIFGCERVQLGVLYLKLPQVNS